MTSVLGTGARTRRALGVGVTVAALAFAGCGSGESSDSGDSSGASGASGETSAIVREAIANTERNMAGTDRELPREGPRAVRGKTVWAIACSAQGAGCALPARAEVEAGRLLGWNMKFVDGKQDPTVYNAQIRAAAAAGADAVILNGIDCAQTKGAIVAAQRAGTRVYGAGAHDCDDQFAGEEPLFDGRIRWAPEGEPDDYGTFQREIVGKAIADWVIARTDGKAKVIELREDDSAVTRHVGLSFRERLAECDSCEHWETEYTGMDLVTGKLQGKASAALQQRPQANVLMSPLDAAIALGVGAAAEQARLGGRELLLTGNEGNPSNIPLIRRGTQSFAVGRAMTWTGWAAIDGLNRLFAGEEQVDPGIGIQPMDEDHLPPGDMYDGNARSAGYQDNYKRIWGIG
ncbi:substrate-binding domain-containing protein [Conexibacter arvalis]|uniref:Ribose transport system substrate-binding protein n=1 Tax=Conexibacter arvalis TaxID=912552 RepID=A0A840IFZ8_9ACTN|nr:substrate-binding domain-containing protein [Conexibacter arvalis]MBB4662870.1 ribose transport system substrate-binding protein [Conexibacter arvalis]